MNATRTITRTVGFAVVGILLVAQGAWADVDATKPPPPPDTGTVFKAPDFSLSGADELAPGTVSPGVGRGRGWIDWKDPHIFGPPGSLGERSPVPEGIDPGSPLLSQREMLLRAGALADETRLRIVRLISDEGEMRSQEVMDRLSLSQSAASRHLTQLVSAGYLTVRKDAGAKSYRVDPDSVRKTTESFRRYLLGL